MPVLCQPGRGGLYEQRYITEVGEYPVTEGDIWQLPIRRSQYVQKLEGGKQMWVGFIAIDISG